LPQTDGDLRVGLAELLQRCRQIHLSPRHQGAQRDRRHQLAAVFLYRRFGSMSCEHDFAGVIEEDLARGSERDLALGTVEQIDAQLFFQSAYRRRQCRLHDVDSLGRPGEVQPT
jgi:hypothetical protein